MLCGIADELAPSTASVSFFFCQAPDARINTATAVLRGLIYQLVSQQPSLVAYVRRNYDVFGKELFEGPNAWDSLSEIFTGMLADPVSQSTFLIVDALDECIADLPLLLGLIAPGVSQLQLHMRNGLVSSHNWPDIQGAARYRYAETQAVSRAKCRVYLRRG